MVRGHRLAGMATTPLANSSRIGEELVRAAVPGDVAFAIKKDTTDGAAHKGLHNMKASYKLVSTLTNNSRFSYLYVVHSKQLQHCTCAAFNAILYMFVQSLYCVVNL